MHNRMKALQEQIYACTQGHVESASTEELGQAVDMIKDLAEGIYYEQKAKLITKELECMEEDEMAKKLHYRDMDKMDGRMYYDGMPSRGGRPPRGWKIREWDSEEEEYPREWDRASREEPYRIGMRDSREGRSPISRRNYMESKEMHKDKTAKIKDLEKYMQELSEDITEMIQDASPEEKQVLDKKITALASKISALNV